MSHPQGWRPWNLRAPGIQVGEWPHPCLMPAEVASPFRTLPGTSEHLLLRGEVFQGTSLTLLLVTRLPPLPKACLCIWAGEPWFKRFSVLESLPVVETDVCVFSYWLLCLRDTCYLSLASLRPSCVAFLTWGQVLMFKSSTSLPFP